MAPINRGDGEYEGPGDNGGDRVYWDGTKFVRLPARAEPARVTAMTAADMIDDFGDMLIHGGMRAFMGAGPAHAHPSDVGIGLVIKLIAKGKRLKVALFGEPR